MARWDRGDPIPEDWPAWLKEADILWCEVEISDGAVIWHNGVWQNGAWKDGTWQQGTWKGGIWQNGFWLGGLWYGGIWQQGTWENGTWLQGIWHAGTWKGGLWKGGLWKAGIWEGGTWRSGIWSPAPKRVEGPSVPRFSGRLMVDLRGQMHLDGLPIEDTPQELANEAKLLRLYYELELQEGTKGTSVWDHLDDLV